MTGNVALTRAAAACSGADICHRYQTKNQRRVDDKHAVATGTATQAQFNKVLFSTLPFVFTIRLTRAAPGASHKTPDQELRRHGGDAARDAAVRPKRFR